MRSEIDTDMSMEFDKKVTEISQNRYLQKAVYLLAINFPSLES